MKVLLSFGIVLLAMLPLSYYVTRKEKVLVLTQYNFQSAIDKNHFIMVDFYSPWCILCQALEPEYEKAAELLQERGSEVKLAKVDATDETEVAEMNNVRGYPTLKLYISGKSIEYTGARKAESIVAWLMKKTGPPATHISSAEDMKDFAGQKPPVIIGFFKD